MRGLIYASLVAAVVQCAGVAAEPVGPMLGAASNFGQSWQPRALSGAMEKGITEFRDEVIWNHVQQADGRLVFGSMRESYPHILTARGATMTLLGYSGHPNWEGGAMPQTPEGQATFAAYHAEIVKRFPLIHSFEIGNEFNSWEFAEEEGWPSDLAARAEVYAALLERTVPTVKKVRPNLRILGGAAHSIPIAWAQALSEAGALSLMDAFVLHPYTTPAEQLARQIRELRRVSGLETMPIEVTEFGTPDEEAAPGYLLRMYCQMAISGVAQATWYPFSPRGDGLVPLVTKDGQLTTVGHTYRLIHQRMAGAPVRNVSPDPYTYACRFGDHTLVLWGAPRSVELGYDLDALDPTGQPREGDLLLSETNPIVIVSSGSQAPELGQTVHLGMQRVLADSFHNFRLDPNSNDGGFEASVRQRGEHRPFETRLGQDRDGVPWTPHLGDARDGHVQLTADTGRPSSWGAEDPLEIVHLFTADRAALIDLEIEVAPSEASDDGISLDVTHNGRSLLRAKVHGAERLIVSAVAIEADDRLAVILGPNANANGDDTRFRVRVLEAQ